MGDLKFLKHDEVAQLLAHPKCLKIAQQLGHQPYQVHYDNVVGGPGICSPFFKELHVMTNTAQHWEELLDHYIELLDDVSTVEKLDNLVWETKRPSKVSVAAYLHRIGRYDPAQWDINKWWKFLIDIWRDSEMIYQDKEHHFAYLFGLIPTIKRLTKPLPKGKFTIYRGGHPDGDSWTLDQQKAEWFANRFPWSGGKVYEKTVTSDQVLFYTDERDEKEVLLKTILQKVA